MIPIVSSGTFPENLSCCCLSAQMGCDGSPCESDTHLSSRGRVLTLEDDIKHLPGHYANICMHPLSWIKSLHKLPHLVIFFDTASQLPCPMCHKYHWQRCRCCALASPGRTLPRPACISSLLPMTECNRHPHNLWAAGWRLIRALLVKRILACTKVLLVLSLSDNSNTSIAGGVR